MEVIKVIVSGGLPETCRDCDFLDYAKWSANFDNPVSEVYWCTAKCKPVCEVVSYDKDIVEKPDWCPLVEDLYIEWLDMSDDQP